MNLRLINYKLIINLNIIFMHMVIMHTIIRIIVEHFYLTNGPKGAIIIKLSTREHERTEESAGNLGIRERAVD